MLTRTEDADDNFLSFKNSIIKHRIEPDPNLPDLLINKAFQDHLKVVAILKTVVLIGGILLSVISFVVFFTFEDDV